MLVSMLWSQFSAIFGEKIGVFLRNQCYDNFISKFSFVLSQKRQFFAKFVGENIFKIITSVPDSMPAIRVTRRCRILFYVGS
jgi:hypothetical protein